MNVVSSKLLEILVAVQQYCQIYTVNIPKKKTNLQGLIIFMVNKNKNKKL